MGFFKSWLNLRRVLFWLPLTILVLILSAAAYDLFSSGFFEHPPSETVSTRPGTNRLLAKILDEHGGVLEEAIPADPEAKRAAGSTVAEAVSALIHHDIEAHLTHITDDVRLHVGDSDTVVGKQQYKGAIELIFRTENVTSVEVRHVLSLDQERFLVIVREEHQLQRPEAPSIKQSEIVHYRVDAGKIAEVNWTGSRLGGTGFFSRGIDFGVHR